MSSQPRSILSLSKLAAKFPEKDAFFDLLVATMTDRNDRAAVLTVVSLLEGALQKSLATKFIADDKGKLEYMFGSGAPLRDFSAKIKMGFALGVYGPNTRADLDSIREVRNSFAHTMSPIYFNTPEVENVCKRIIILDQFDILDPFDLSSEIKDASTRICFITTAMYFAAVFYFIAHPIGLGLAESQFDDSEDEPWWSHFKRAMVS